MDRQDEQDGTGLSTIMSQTDSDRRMPGLRVVAGLLFLLLAGCGPSSPGGLPTTSMQIGSRTYQLEIASDDASRDHGLMERDAMDSDHGMIFVFPDTQERNFWMKHTRFALDIIFADDAGTVVSTHSMNPYDLNNTPSDAPAKYAIELCAGQVSANGIKPGDKLRLPQAVVAVNAE
jgi:hypothetical protein